MEKTKAKPRRPIFIGHPLEYWSIQQEEEKLQRKLKRKQKKLDLELATKRELAAIDRAIAKKKKAAALKAKPKKEELPLNRFSDLEL